MSFSFSDPLEIGRSSSTDGASVNGNSQPLITTSMINDGAVTTAKIADDAVTHDKISANAVDGTQILDNAIDTDHLIDDAVTRDKIDKPAALGPSKAILLLKQEVSGSSEISVSATHEDNRAPLHTQTGEWTLSNKATDWLCANGGGLCYFGHITAQPICADIELWVRWKSGNEEYQSWGRTQSRVEPVELGGDRLMIVKLYAGGSSGGEHVDCAVGSGYKFAKLSSLSAPEGAKIQFNLGFRKQSPSPNYTARRWFLRVDIMDGSMISANY